MDVLVVCDAGVERHDVMELPRLLERQDAVIWVDIPMCDKVGVEVLSEVFGFHRIAVHDCVERNHVSKVHIYPDHVFTVLHAPQPGEHGHVHYVELDQFIGRNYLVTVHGPLNPAVNPQVAFLDTGAVRRRIEEKNLHISSPFELSHWIVSALIRRESDLPALPGWLSGDRDVTAEAHEHPATCEIGRPRRDAVGGQRLRRGAEVQPDAARRTQRPLLGVPLQSPPPGRRTGGCYGPVVVADLGEIAVVAQRANGPTDRRVDGAVGQLRRPERNGHRPCEQRPHLDGGAACGVHAGDLRVGAEAAARRVDRGQLLDQDRTRGRQTRRVGREERDRGPPYGPLDPARRAAGHDAPEVVRPGRVARRGGWTGGCRAFGAGDDTGCA